MICYRDKTFCSAECLNMSCHRQFTPEVDKGSQEWWSHDPDNAPVAFSDFSGDCPEYIPPTNFN
jgi:hypothetical protein